MRVSAPTQAVAEERGALRATEYFSGRPWVLDQSRARPMVTNGLGEVFLYEVHLTYYAIDDD